MFERLTKWMENIQDNNAPKADLSAEYPIGCILMGAGIAKRFQAADPDAPDPYANETEKEHAKRMKEEERLAKHNAKLEARGKYKVGENPVLKRFDNKLTADYNGKPLIRHAADALSTIGFASYIAVLREHETGLALEGTPFRVVWNHSKKNFSPSLTIQFGILALPEGVKGALFAVGDQPHLSAVSTRKLCDKFMEDPSKIVVLTYEGTPGNPCIFPASLFDELLALDEGQNGKVVVGRHPELVETVEAESIEEFADIDTKAELRIAQEEGIVRVLEDRERAWEELNDRLRSERAEREKE
ncbi:MAG: nucleotidyltransferase family protein [Firmicutes bacterium]|nr:nucleotidyltransferase family protein [Bacillota bacterium]